MEFTITPQEPLITGLNTPTKYREVQEIKLEGLSISSQEPALGLLTVVLLCRTKTF